MIKAITRGLRQAGMPLDCSRIMPWQNRKISPSTAAATSTIGLPNHSAASASGNSSAGDPGFARHPGALRLAQHVHEAQRPADLEHQQRQAAGDDRERGERRQQRRNSGKAGDRGNAEQSGAGAAAQEIAGGFPVPMFLMPGLDAAGAHAPGLRRPTTRALCQPPARPRPCRRDNGSPARCRVRHACGNSCARAAAARRCCWRRRDRRNAARRRCRH